VNSAPHHIALVTGGTAVSLAAGRDITDSLSEQGFAITRLDDKDDLVARLLDLQPDLVFSATAGAALGNGPLQGACELLGLPHTHSGLAASALAADRHLAKMVFKSAGIPVTDHVLAGRAEAGRTHILPPPYVAKPRHRGTGGALIIVRHAKEPPPEALLSESWADAEDVVVERFLPGETLTVFIMGDVVLGVAATADATKNRDAETTIPASISPKIYEKCTRLALRAHGVLEGRGVAALALRFNESQGFGDPIALDYQTQPDLGRTAPLVRIAARAGHSFDELLRWIVQDGSCGKGN
jgi:D-alanine-D-alanine ligase